LMRLDQHGASVRQGYAVFGDAFLEQRLEQRGAFGIGNVPSDHARLNMSMMT